MSANYKLVRNPNPGKDGKVQPLHARLVSNGTLSIEEIMEDAQARSSFSTADIKGMLQLFQDLMASYLAMGYNVKLEGIGTFSVSLKCRPVMDEKEIRSESVYFKDINYRSSAQLRERLRSMHLYRAEKEKGIKNFTLEERRERMLYMIDRYRYITRRTYMQVNHCSQTKALNDLNLFLKDGLIARYGRGATRFYMRKQIE